MRKNTNKNSYKYSDAEFIEVCRKSLTMRDAAAEMQIPFMTFRRRAVKLDCYVTNQGGHGKHDPSYMSALDYIKSSSCIHINILREKLIRDGIKEYKCEICGCSEWLGKPIALELHHKDGNRLNNSLDNLIILCPNCHAYYHDIGHYNKKGMDL